MLRKIDDQTVLSLGTARAQYPKSKIIFIITDMSDMSDIRGNVFMVSDNDDSFDDLTSDNDDREAIVKLVTMSDNTLTLKIRQSNYYEEDEAFYIQKTGGELWN